MSWTKDKSEVEIVDLVLKLREKLVRQNPTRILVLLMFTRCCTVCVLVKTRSSWIHSACFVNIYVFVSSAQVKGRRLQLKDEALDKLDSFINSTITSLPGDLQRVLSAR